MKKLTVITFGLMGLIFGLVFTSTKINASEISYPSSIYWSQQDGDNISILAPELPNSFAGRFNFFDFIEQWDSYYTTNIKYAIITIQPVKIEYIDNTYNYSYNGYIDTIIIIRNKTSGYLGIQFYYTGSIKSAYSINNYDVIQGTFIITNSVQDEFGDIRYDTGYRIGYQAGRTVGLEEGQLGSEELYNKAYKIGYEEAKKYYYELGYTEGYELISEVEFEKGFQQGVNDGYNNGYNKGYQDGVSTVYENGFGGIINPDTNQPYDETYSYPYNTGYNAGVASKDDYSFTGLLFQVFNGMGAILTIELLPNITIGALVAVPVVFGIIYFILGKRSGEK